MLQAGLFTGCILYKTTWPQAAYHYAGERLFLNKFKKKLALALE